MSVPELYSTFYSFIWIGVVMSVDAALSITSPRRGSALTGNDGSIKL